MIKNILYAEQRILFFSLLNFWKIFKLGKGCGRNLVTHHLRRVIALLTYVASLPLLPRHQLASGVLAAGVTERYFYNVQLCASCLRIVSPMILQ